MADIWKPVKLAAKVIGHISQGMYRTPAGAVKELISNAYDADATYVKIHTGFPRFDVFSCEDDGIGISQAKFIELMSGGIGDSEKQTQADRIGKNGRPIIGRLGVGLLSLAQICPRFAIRSFHAETKTAFEAEIEFPPYSRQEIDRFVGEQKLGDEGKLITHGKYKFSKLPYAPGKHGILVTTTALRDSFRKTMSNLDKFANKNFHGSRESYPSFESFLSAVANPTLSSLYFASQYDQFIFGLALAAPIPYVEEEHRKDLNTLLIRIPPISAVQKKLQRYDFRTEIDNIELRRPVILPSTGDKVRSADCSVKTSPKTMSFVLRDGPLEEKIEVDRYDITVKGKPDRFQLFWFEYSRKVNGYPLKFSGYIFLQTKRLFPKEYQGILIRLRNVAIGQYDVNVMTYPQAEGPRFSMLSAEVFVDEGLDDALKVDRDGFNTLDPQYIRLQAFVHSILHQLIFPGSWEEEKSRNRQLRYAKEQEVKSRFSRALRKVSSQSIMRVEIVPRRESRSQNVPVAVDEVSRTLKIYEGNAEARTLLGRKKFHGIAARVIAAFEAANLEKSSNKRREIFYQLIGKIFNE
jgi:hypothetical protein